MKPISPTTSNKRECYRQIRGLADHHVESVWVPFRDNAILPFHLPPGTTAPAIRGDRHSRMDSFKEGPVAHGDRFLNRGMAVLCDRRSGPIRTRPFRPRLPIENGWRRASPRVLAHRSGRISRVAHLCSARVSAHFFAPSSRPTSRVRSTFAAIVGVPRPRLQHESFRSLTDDSQKLFMYMSGITERTISNRFRSPSPGTPQHDNPRTRSSSFAGRCEESSPSSIPEAAHQNGQGPSIWWSYLESRHSVGNVPAANLGPFPPILAR